MSDLTALLAVLLPSISALAAFAWRQHKNALKEAADSAVEKERAETYKREATKALEAKNEELAQAEVEKEELREILNRCLNEEIPRLQRAIDSRETHIRSLTESFEWISDRIGRIAEKMGVSLGEAEGE